MNTVALKTSIKEALAVARREIADEIMKRQRAIRNDRQITDFNKRIDALSKQRDALVERFEKSQLEPLRRQLKALQGRAAEINNELAFVITDKERMTVRTKTLKLLADMKNR